MTFHAVVPAGGAGTRLWPLSRRDDPKFLHDLTGSGRSLLQQTVDRLTPLADQVLVVTGAAQQQTVAAQLPALPAEQILAEPSPRESMAAIGLAAAVLLHRYPDQDVVIGSFAADHVIGDGQAYADAVEAAVAAARRDHLATIGIEPTSPASGFGYIDVGAQLPELAARAPVHQVRSFTEKPDVRTATEYLAAGHYQWNAGMFVVRARVLMDHLAVLQPPLAEGLTTLGRVWDTPARADHLDRIWPALTKIAIDHAIAEPVAAAGGVVVVPGKFAWDDVGDWHAVSGLLGADARGVAVLGDDAATTAVDSSGAVLVPGTGRQVVVLGVPDAVVVDTPDAVLVTTAEHAQAVKNVVAQLDQGGRADLL